MREVEFFLDVGSPTTYLAWTQLPALCRAQGAALKVRPMLLGAIFQATGNASPANVPAKSRWMNADMVRLANRYGVPFALNPSFPINTLVLMRGATGMQMHEPARFGAYVDAMYHAMWVAPRNLNDPAIVGAVLQEAGFDAAKVLALANAQDVKDRLKAVTQEAVERGVFGAPTMFVGPQMFWGQDRLDFVREELARA